MTLDDLKSTGIIPAEIDNNKLLRICSSLGFNVSSGMKSKLTDYQISKLNYSKIFNEARIRKTVTDKYSEVIGMYADLEKKYQVIINQMKTNNTFLPERRELEQLVSKIKADKNQYIANLGTLNFNNHDDVYNFNKTGVITDLIGSISSAREIIEESKARNVDIKAKELERKLQSLNSSNTKSIVNKIKINHISKKLARLQSKKGSIRDKQQRIISSNTDLYVGIMNKKFAEYKKYYDKVAAKFDEKAEVVSNINSLNNTITDLKKANMRLEASRSEKNIFQQISINKEQRNNKRNIRKIERQIKRLKAKQGRINVKLQAVKASNGTFAR